MPDDQRRTEDLDPATRRTAEGDDAYRPDGTPPGATAEERARTGDIDHTHAEAGVVADGHRDPDARQADPVHTANASSGSAHAGVETPRSSKSRTLLIVAVAAVLGIASAFWLMGEGVEEATETDGAVVVTE